jgi:acetyl esterase/lipase
MHVRPRLRPLLEAARGQPTLADVPVEQARAQIAARTAARPRGPVVNEVMELVAEGSNGAIPIRVYRPQRPLGVVVAFHGWRLAHGRSRQLRCHLQAFCQRLRRRGCKCCTDLNDSIAPPAVDRACQRWHRRSAD